MDVWPDVRCAERRAEWTGVSCVVDLVGCTWVPTMDASERSGQFALDTLCVEWEGGLQYLRGDGDGDDRETRCLPNATWTASTLTSHFIGFGSSALKVHGRRKGRASTEVTRKSMLRVNLIIIVRIWLDLL